MSLAIPFHTLSGPIDLAALCDGDMTAAIIVDTLAKLPRYNGRTGWLWSVAAHSLLVEHLAPPDLKGWALLHDAHEAFLGDITTPVVELLCRTGGPGVEKAIEAAKLHLDHVIARAWGYPCRSHSLAIRQADWLALQAEMAVFFGTSLSGLGPAERQQADATVACIQTLPRLSWIAVRDAWIRRAEVLAQRGLLRLPPALLQPHPVSPARTGHHPQRDARP